MYCPISITLIKEMCVGFVNCHALLFNNFYSTIKFCCRKIEKEMFVCLLAISLWDRMMIVLYKYERRVLDILRLESILLSFEPFLLSEK